jgi:hypothetical protein
MILQKAAGIAQSVQGLATGWTAEGSEFQSRQGEDFFFLLNVVQTGSGAHPAHHSLTYSSSQSQSHTATDGQSVSLGVEPHICVTL